MSPWATSPTGPAWINGVPPLALEYASMGQDEQKLQEKIADLLSAGTRWVWVVRLVGERHVEVYEAKKPMQKRMAGELLSAPGVAQNPVPVEALFDRKAAHEVVLRNLLQRRGYESLDAVRDEGRKEELVRLYERRLGRPLSDSERRSLSGRLERLGSDRIGDVVLDLDAGRLAAWLADESSL
jgi:hypothetical protein